MALIFMPVLFPDSNRNLVNGSQRALSEHLEMYWDLTESRSGTKPEISLLSFLLDFFCFVLPFHASISSLNHWTVINILIITLCP